jgi:hypothetical protein
LSAGRCTQFRFAWVSHIWDAAQAARDLRCVIAAGSHSGELGAVHQNLIFVHSGPERQTCAAWRELFYPASQFYDDNRGSEIVEESWPQKRATRTSYQTGDRDDEALRS